MRGVGDTELALLLAHQPAGFLERLEPFLEPRGLRERRTVDETNGL